MRLSRVTVGLMQAVREGAKRDGCRGQALEVLRHQLQYAKDRVTRINAEKPWSKGAAIGRGQRLARARNEVRKWEELEVELHMPPPGAMS